MHFDVAVYAHFARSSGADMRIAAAIRHFHAHRAIYHESFIKRPSALDCGLHPASTKAAQAASETQPSLCERVMCVFAVSWLASRTSRFATPGHPSYQRYTRKRNQKFPTRLVLIL